VNKPVIVHVTQDDIDHGQRISSTNCPVARAMSRDLGVTVHVGWGDVLIGNQRYVLAEIADEWAARFDNREKVEPLTFSFDYTLKN
jgi:hypothetical protein